MFTTLNKIREHSPCSDGWEKLLKHLGKTKADDESLSLITVLDSNGLDDTLWCLRAVDGFDREIRLFAVACARDVQHLMQDERSINALDVADRYANGEATNDELIAALDAAWAARSAAMDSAAWYAAYAAWYAAYALDARDAALDARDAALDARDAAWYAAYALDAAWYAAYALDAAWAARDAAEAAWADIKTKQEQRFREMVLKLENTGA